MTFWRGTPPARVPSPPDRSWDGSSLHNPRCTWAAATAFALTRCRQAPEADLLNCEPQRPAVRHESMMDHSQRASSAHSGARRAAPGRTTARGSVGVARPASRSRRGRLPPSRADGCRAGRAPERSRRGSARRLSVDARRGQSRRMLPTLPPDSLKLHDLLSYEAIPLHTDVRTARPELDSPPV